MTRYRCPACKGFGTTYQADPGCRGCLESRDLDHGMCAGCCGGDVPCEECRGEGLIDDAPDALLDAVEEAKLRVELVERANKAIAEAFRWADEAMAGSAAAVSVAHAAVSEDLRHARELLRQAHDLLGAVHEEAAE